MSSKETFMGFLARRRGEKASAQDEDTAAWTPPQIVDEDYSTAESTVNNMDLDGDFGRGVEITEDEFYRRVCEAFQRRMRDILSPEAIRQSMDNPVFSRMVMNKYKEVAKDRDNAALSQKRVIAGHIASLMHSLVLAFG